MKIDLQPSVNWSEGRDQNVVEAYGQLLSVLASIFISNGFLSRAICCRNGSMANQMRSYHVRLREHHTFIVGCTLTKLYSEGILWLTTKISTRKKISIPVLAMNLGMILVTLSPKNSFPWPHTASMNSTANRVAGSRRSKARYIRNNSAGLDVWGRGGGGREKEREWVSKQCLLRHFNKMYSHLV